MSLDPVVTIPDHYRVLFENERVRVLEYEDSPGDATTSHRHPDSVMVTLSSFGRRLVHGDQERDVEMPAGRASWLPAQSHRGVNTGSTGPHAILVELKEPTSTPGGTQPADIGPVG